MLFTPDDVVTSARDKARRARNVQLDVHMIARTITSRLRALIQKYSQNDPERLAEEVIVSNADVIADPDNIDLTASSLREWMSIISMDWRSSVTAVYGNEVVVGTIEARHRLEFDYEHLSLPVAYFFDRMRQLKKVAGWDGVFDLRIYGVLVPPTLDPQDPVDNLQVLLDYPEPVFRALQTGFLLSIATHLKPSELELSIWAEEHKEAMVDVSEDAEEFVGQGLRIEDVPHKEFYDGN